MAGQENSTDRQALAKTESGSTTGYSATAHPRCKLSPAELCMGRWQCTPVAVTIEQLIPTSTC